MNDSGIFIKKILTGAFYRIFQFSNVRKKSSDVKFKQEFIINCFLGFYIILAILKVAMIG